MVRKLHLAMAVAVGVALSGATAQAADPSPGNASVVKPKTLWERGEAALRFYASPECRAKLEDANEAARRENKPGKHWVNPFVVCGSPPELQ